MRDPVNCGSTAAPRSGCGGRPARRARARRGASRAATPALRRDRRPSRSSAATASGDDAAAAELIEREQRDVRVAIAGGGQRRRHTPSASWRIAQRCAAPRAARSASRRRGRRVSDAVQLRGRDLRRARPPRAHRQPADLRVGIVRRGSQRLDVDARRRSSALRARGGGRARR